jgi:hypothetical protein
MSGLNIHDGNGNLNEEGQIRKKSDNIFNESDCVTGHSKFYTN